MKINRQKRNKVEDTLLSLFSKDEQQDVDPGNQVKKTNMNE